MGRLLRIAIIIGLTQGLLFGCGGTHTVRNFEPEQDDQQKAIIFGFFQITYAGRDVTQGAVIYFDHGEILKLEKDGFVAAHVIPGYSGIAKVTIENGSGTEYTLPNLRFRAGYPGTKTYFGNITLDIDVPPPMAADVAEKWAWKVENQWKTAWQQWNKVFGSDKRKFYASIVERKGPDKPQSRALATDRQEVIPGF